MTEQENQTGAEPIDATRDDGAPDRARRPYVRRAAVRDEEAAREPTRPTKQRLRRGVGYNLYDVPKPILEALWNDHGVDIQFNLDTVKGADGREIHDLPFAVTRVGMEQQGWESVMPGMFDGLLDGLFTKKGHEGEILVGGQVLQWRPIELTLEARAEERSAAKQAIGTNEQRMKSGEIPGVDSSLFNPNHPKARAVSQLTKSRVATIPVPS